MTEKTLFEQISAMSESPFIEYIEKVWGKNLSSYFKTSIEDQDYLQSLMKNANNFEVNGTSLPLTLIQELVFDFGGRTFNESITISAINPDRSLELVKYVSEQLSIELDYVNSGFGYIERKIFSHRITKETGNVCYQIKEFVIIMTTQENNFGVYLLDKNGISKLYFNEVKQAENHEVNLDNIFPPKSTKFTGFYNSFLVKKGEKLIRAKLKRTSRITKSFEEKRLDTSIFEGDDYEIYANEIESEEELDQDEYNSILLFSIGLIPEGWQPAVTIPTLSLIIGVGTSPGSNVGTGTGWGPDWGTGGPAGCIDYDSRDRCRGCCDAWQGISTSNAGLAWVGCHASVGCCPGAHVACVIAGLAAIALIAIGFETCRNNCNFSFERDTFFGPGM